MLKSLIFTTGEGLSDKKEYNITLSDAYKYVLIYIKATEAIDFNGLGAIAVQFKTEKDLWYYAKDEEGIEIYGRILGAGDDLYIKAFPESKYIKIIITPIYTDVPFIFDIHVYEVLDEMAVSR